MLEDVQLHIVQLLQNVLIQLTMPIGALLVFILALQPQSSGEET